MRHIIWRNRASAILGILVILIPFTGFPEGLRNTLIILLGLAIVIFGFSRSSAVGYNYQKEDEGEEKLEDDQRKDLDKTKSKKINRVKKVETSTEKFSNDGQSNLEINLPKIEDEQLEIEIEKGNFTEEDKK